MYTAPHHTVLNHMGSFQLFFFQKTLSIIRSCIIWEVFNSSLFRKKRSILHSNSSTFQGTEEDTTSLDDTDMEDVEVFSKQDNAPNVVEVNNISTYEEYDSSVSSKEKSITCF